MEQMTDSRLASILAAEEHSAVGYRNSDVSADQDRALDLYYGDAENIEGLETEPGKSGVVSRDVANVVDWLVPGILRMFIGNSEAVCFDPIGPEDEQFAKQATKLINYQFYRENNGFRVARDWLKTGLLQKLGVVKVYWDDTPKTKRETYEGLDIEQITFLQNDENVEIIEATEYPAPEQILYDVTFLRTCPNGRAVIDMLPPEEVLVAKKTVCLQTTDYAAHRCRKTISELLQMGFDEKIVMSLGDGQDESGAIDEREQNRFEDEEITDDDTPLDPSMRRVWVLEEYVKIDYDGDGIAEFRKVTRVGNTILENVEIEETAFVGFCPNPMPNRLFGQSMADKVEDLQIIKSTLWRQTLDNLYLSNSPMREVPEAAIGEDTLEDLLTVRPGGIIRSAAAGMIREVTVPFVAGSSFQMMEYIDGERDERTGSIKQIGLGPNHLNLSATEAHIINESGAELKEEIARLFGEAMAELFRKMLRLNIRHQDRQKTVRIAGQWVPVEPNAWNADMDVIVQVGLGTGKKDQRIASRLNVLNLQKELSPMGMATPEQVYANLEGIVADMGLGSAAKYFTQSAQQQQGPSPEMQKMQMEMQMDAQKQAANHELEMQKLQMEDARKREQAAAELQLKREMASAELQLKRDLALMGANSGDITTRVHLGGEPG